MILQGVTIAIGIGNGIDAMGSGEGPTPITNYLVTEDGNQFISEDGDNFITN